MTENEAKRFIQGKLDCMNKCDVFDCKNTDECNSCNYCYSQGNFGEQKQSLIMAIQALEEVHAYRAIGTIEEFKALKEKSVAKKVISFDYRDGHINYGCPTCKRKIISKIDGEWCAGFFQEHCDRCGQKLDWSEE